MTRTKRWVFLIGAGVLVVGATVAMATRTKGGDAKQGGTPLGKAAVADVQVEVLEVGTVAPGVKVDVKSALSGKVVELKVREGDVVKRGQVLASIEPDVNQAQQLAGVRRTVNQAQIDLVDAETDLHAKDELLKDGLVSLELHRTADTRYRSARESYDAAKEKATIVASSGIPVTGNASQMVNITAPMDGVVITRPVELGEAVTGAGSFNSGTVLMTVADLSTMLVRAGVNEVDIGKVALGAPVTVTLDAYPKMRFPARVARIAPAARLQDQVKVFDVEVALDTQGKELRTGMTANVSIKGEKVAAALAVPIESVFRRDDGEFVYVKRVKSDTETGATPAPKATPDPREAWKLTFVERKVETGLASLARVQIVKGLATGEEVALEDPTKPKKKES